MLSTEETSKVSPVPIWRCKDSSCKAWVRAELTTESSPSCPICNGAMMKSMKHLPELVNKIKKQKKDK